MSRLNAVAPESVTGKVKDLLDAVRGKFGMVPNVIREMANAPAVLDAYLQFSGALARGTLRPIVREQIALAVAQANGCDYCLAAHSASGKAAGLTAEQIRGSRLGVGADPATDALVRFARKVVDARGRVSDEDIEAVRAAGFDDGAIAEVVANVALNILTNYYNIVADSEIDFTRAEMIGA